MKKKQSGMVNLSTLTRLARRVYPDDASPAGELHLNWIVKERWQISFDRTFIAHPDRAVARKMAKAALEAAIRATAPRKRPKRKS
jgi:hypothetical protein